MNKVTLEFDVQDESNTYKQAIFAEEAFMAISDIRDYLRRKYKHTDPATDSHLAEHEETCVDIFNILEESGIPESCF